MPQYISVDDKLNREKQSEDFTKIPVVLLESHDEPRCKSEVFASKSYYTDSNIEETGLQYLIPAKTLKASLDASRLLTYSEIHAENVRSRDENRISEEGYSRIHSMQLQTQKELNRRRDAASCNADRIASLSRVPSSNPNRPRSIDIKGEALCNHSSPVEINELENDCNNQVVDCFGTGKRFYEANGRRRPTPYHTNALDCPRRVQLSSSHSKSVSQESSRESSALKNILIKKLEAPLSILKAFSASSFSLLKNEKTSSVRASAVNKRNTHDDDRILSERSKQRTGHIYDGGSIIELADDDSYCAHYDRLQSIKQAQLLKKGRGQGQGQGQGRYKVGNTAAAGFSVLHTERSAIRKKKAPTDSSADQTKLKIKQREFFDIMAQTVNHMKEDNHYTEKSNEKEKVKFLENSILEHISGRLGNLRHSLNKMDFSRSGVLNYEEFRSVIAQRGVNMSPADVQKVFVDRAIDSRNKGQINEGGITAHDLRYSSGLAVNIQQYIEHLSEREKERVEVIPREYSSNKECFSERLKFKNRDFLSQKKYDDYHQSLHNGGDTHTHQRDDVATSSSRRRPTTTASATSRLESDKHLLGSNLSDDEFKILLEVVGTSHDGKISLSEFDKIVNYSLINPSNTSTHGHPNNTNNSSITNNHRYSDKNGSTASNSSNDYNNRNVKFDILDYEKFDKKNKIAWDKVREIRSSSAREHSFPDTTQIHNNTFDITATSHPHHQSTGRPHQVSRGRNLVPDKFTRRSHSLNCLGSPRTQDIRGLCKQDFATAMEDFNRHDTKDSWTPDSSYSAQYSSYPIQAHVDRELNKRKNFSSISFNHHDQASYSESLTSRGRKRSVAQPQYAHTRDPSRFWELTQTNIGQRETFPVYQSTTSSRNSTPSRDSSGDMPRNRSSVIKSLTRHTGPAVEISLGAVIGDTKAVQSASENITHPLSVRFATAPCEDRDTSHITTNLLNAFKVEVEEKGIQSSATPLEVSYKKIRSLSAPASRPSIQGSTGNREDPPCLRGLRGTKTPTPVIVMGPIEEAFDPGYATTPVNMRSTTLFASSSENSSLGTTSISTSNRCSANTSGTNSPYESDIINTGKYNNRAYVTSTSIGNALKNLSVNNQDNNNNTISENTRKLQNLIPKCLSVKNSTVSNPGQKSVNAPRYPDYTNSYSSDGMRNTPTVSRIEDPRSRIEDPRSRIEDPRSTPEAEKSFSHVFSPRKDLNIPPPPRSHVLVGGGGKK